MMNDINYNYYVAYTCGSHLKNSSYSSSAYMVVNEPTGEIVKIASKCYFPCWNAYRMELMAVYSAICSMPKECSGKVYMNNSTILNILNCKWKVKTEIELYTKIARELESRDIEFCLGNEAKEQMNAVKEMAHEVIDKHVMKNGKSVTFDKL